MSKDRELVIRKIRSVADYQFGRGVGKILFPDDVEVTFSKSTGRIRHVYLNGKRLATFRPNDGLFSLAIEGAKRIVKHLKPLRFWVMVSDEAAPFVAEGKSVFAKHVVDADKEGEVLAVGRALLNGEEMVAFKRGVAVKVRVGKNKVKKLEEYSISEDD